MLEHFQNGGGFAAPEVVCPEFVLIAARRMIDGADNTLHDVIDKGEIALQRAAGIELDWLIGKHRAGEFENRHVWASPRTVYGEQSKGGYRKTVLVGVAIGH